jgi:hypothetical protein
METLLTEIMSFFGNCEGIPAYEAGPQLQDYFNMLQRFYRGFARMIADESCCGE